ncbi:MAG: glycosyltransferase [Clostridiales Family XIII bacterium]|jgi:glycosyltransferase involved in cell wall biosynthesis|nr:glycosyltransferase [Clostridiales Family XIII bacterium]
MLSVIVPVYNAGEWLEPCVRSILNQSVRDLELILVDDGSADGSGAACDAFAAEDERVCVIHRENGGVSRARNAGLDRAAGDYIAFVDCDDYILPGMYETLLGMLGQTGARIAMCAVIDERESGQILSRTTGETKIFTGEDALWELLNSMGKAHGHQETVWFSVWNKIYDAGLFRTGPEGGEAIRFDPATDSAEDVPINLAAFRNLSDIGGDDDKIAYLETPFYFWRNREGSQSLLRAPAALRGGAETSMLLFDAASALNPERKRIGITAALRHFYWYYTASVYAMSRTDDEGAKQEYAALREEMIDLLKLLKARTAYRYTALRFRITVFFMVKAKGMFACAWLLYRRIRRSA